MMILGFLGSPRLDGNTNKVLKQFLAGAESKGAKTKLYDLINCNIDFCRGCCQCEYENHDLPIGKCQLNDDMMSILNEYIKADGYVFATPNYDSSITALMKKFLERKIALTYRDADDYGKIGNSRCPANFTRKASMIVTANCGDEMREMMGDPCFELMGGHLMIEQVDTVDRFYVGGVESLTGETLAEKLDEAFRMGIRLVEEIKKSRQES